MLNLTDINSFPTQDGGALSLLRDIAQKYCPEDARELRQSVFPDETLHLEELEAGFRQLLSGGSGFEDLPYLGGDDDLKGATKVLKDGDRIVMDASRGRISRI